MNKCRMHGVLVAVSLILMKNISLADTLSHDTAFTLRDGLDCSLSLTPIDGVVDCSDDSSFFGSITNSTFVDETYYEFDLTGLSKADYVNLIVSQTGGHLRSDLPLKISYYIDEDITDLSTFHVGTFLTTLVIDYSDGGIVTQAVNVTSLFNDAIKSVNQFLGFRLHTDTSSQVFISEACGWRITIYAAIGV